MPTASKVLRINGVNTGISTSITNDEDAPQLIRISINEKDAIKSSLKEVTTKVSVKEASNCRDNIPKMEAKLSQTKQLKVDEELNRRKKERVKAEKEEVKAQQAVQLAKEASVCPRLYKRLLLLMALIRTNPRTQPLYYPSHGTVLADGFHWTAYPPLDTLLRKNMRRYYELSTEHSQTRVQVEFNNRLVHLIRNEAAKHGWKFDDEVFDDRKIRDRIRCFYKSHMQNAKKRLNTMLKNPEKRANTKALATFYHLIEEYRQNTEAIIETMLLKNQEKGHDDAKVSVPPKSQVSSMYRDKTEDIFDEKALIKAEKEETARVKAKEEEVKAQQAVQLAKEASVCPRLYKRLLLLMALIRTNPRTQPLYYPSHGTVLADGFHWTAYPPLDTLLRKNMRRYYELSTEHSQTRVQVEFNNRLVHLIRNEAAKHGWKFDDEVFDDRKIRDRIRCFYKSHMQNAKKRLNTMLKNPEKRANTKALATFYHLIEEYRQNTEAIIETMLLKNQEKGHDDAKVSVPPKSQVSSMYRDKTEDIFDEKALPQIVFVPLRKEEENDTSIKATIKAKKEAEISKAVHKPKPHANKRLNSLYYAANELESLDQAQPMNKRAKFNPSTKEGDENTSYMATWANIADQFNISHHHNNVSL